MSYIVNAAIDTAVKASISTPVELLHLTSEKIFIIQESSSSLKSKSTFVKFI